MIKDDDRCIRCGLCAIRCPTEAMTMERFTITERFVPARLQEPVMSDDGQRSSRLPVEARHRRRDRGARAQARRSLRSLVPNVSYDAPTTVKLGLPAEFPDGLKFLPDERLFVFREGNTFHAISAVCTHLGLHRARGSAGATRDGDRGRRAAAPHAPFPLSVPRLRIQGRRHQRAGPAPQPLAWYRLAVAPDDGQLVVDLADEVGRDFRLTAGVT